MTKIWLKIAPSVVLLCLTVAMACQSKPNFETCGGQPVCPPVDANAPADVQQMREAFAGRWKLIRTQTRDTFHKTAGEYRNLDRSLCVSYDGGIQFMIENKAVACLLCYKLSKDATGGRIEVDYSQVSKGLSFCEKSFQSGGITVVGDSLVMTAVDSFVHKRLVYRRANADGTLKGN